LNKSPTFFAVKRDVDLNSEESIKVKEHAILELGELLSKTNQAQGQFIHVVLYVSLHYFICLTVT